MAINANDIMAWNELMFRSFVGIEDGKARINVRYSGASVPVAVSIVAYGSEFKEHICF